MQLFMNLHRRRDASFGIFRRRYLRIVLYKVQEEMNANFAEKEMLSVLLLQFPRNDLAVLPAA